MKLYKYLHPDRIDILKNKSIRFSPPVAFNDPFEFKPVLSGIASSDYFKQCIDEQLDSFIDVKLSEIPDAIKKTLPKSKVREFVKIQIESNGQLFESLMESATKQFSAVLSEKSNEAIGVLSLTQKPDNLLMWSHYADSHKGFCIGFNSEHSFFNRKRSEKDEFYYLRKVEYLKERPTKLMVDMDGTDIFLLKSDVWKYEKEWRMCAVLSDADEVKDSILPAVHLFRFPPDAIDEVIIGANADVNLVDEIVKLLKMNLQFKHVKIKRAVVSDTKYVLEFNDL